MRSRHRWDGVLRLLTIVLFAALLGVAALWGATGGAVASPGDALAGLPSPEPSESPSPSPSPSPVVQTIDVPYTAWNGTALTATLVLPLGYTAENATPLPCIVQPHGRGSRPKWAATVWGDLPTRYGFAVICPDAAGQDGSANSWAAPGQIDDVVAMPDTIEAAVPWVRFDRRSLYLVGSSMGGQESLVSLARAPDRFAAVAAFDGAADLAARYKDMGAAGQRKDQVKLRHELQGVPAQRRFAYHAAQPAVVLPHAGHLRRAAAHRLEYCRRDRHEGGHHPVRSPVPPASRHFPGGAALRGDQCASARSRPARRPHVRRATSWLRAACGARGRSRLRSRGTTQAGSGPWTSGAGGSRCRVRRGRAGGRSAVAGGTISVSTPAYARLSLPWSGDDAVRVVVNGRARRVSPRDGRLTLAFLAGESVAVIRP